MSCVSQAAVTIQRHVRGFLTRIHYHIGDCMWAAGVIQLAVRGFIARRVFERASRQREELRATLLGKVRPVGAVVCHTCGDVLCMAC